MEREHFIAREVLPGIHHIEDAMGVCFTLLCGTERALLVDTGYGLHDVAAFVRSLTQLPTDVLLTHGHHDHVLGARWFAKTSMFAEDQADFSRYTCREKRQEILGQAASKGILCDEAAYLNAAIPMPLPAKEATLDLGGMTVELLRVPGHTPGSAVCYVPKHRLLLTADNWNPCTWLFFPAALPAETFRKNQLERLSPLPFEKVLCSHQPRLYQRDDWERFFHGLTDACLKEAPAVPAGKGMNIDTHQASPAPDMIFVFDWNKTAFARKG